MRALKLFLRANSRYCGSRFRGARKQQTTCQVTPGHTYDWFMLDWSQCLAVERLANSRAVELRNKLLRRSVSETGRMARFPRRERERQGAAAQAEAALAIAALGFIANDPERLERFLSLTGIDPQAIRAAAGEPGFLLGVLDHLASDESLLLAFAQEREIDPDEVRVARSVLAGHEEPS